MLFHRNQRSGRFLISGLLWASLLWLQTGCETAPFGKSEHGFQPRISCFGSKSAKNHVVYLHGMHGQEFSNLERDNLVNLQKVAEVMDMRVAVPQSSRACLSQGRWQRCWGTDMNKEDALHTVQAVQDAANACFGRGENYGIVGFSNGGYIANKIFEYCLAPRYAPRLKYMVSVGSARDWGIGPTSSGSLRACRPITLVVGKNDRFNYQRDPEQFSEFRNRGADASIIVFPGGHELPYGPMVSALRKFMSP